MEERPYKIKILKRVEAGEDLAVPQQEQAS
jgi:hypothetical protein